MKELSSPTPGTPSIYERATPRTDAVHESEYPDTYLYMEALLRHARRLEQELETCRDAHMANCLASDTLRTEIHDLREQLAARSEKKEPPCETCNDVPAVCATVPGLRHCEAAQRSAIGAIERRILTKHCQIGNTVIRSGCYWDTVIARAEREYEYRTNAAPQAPATERPGSGPTQSSLSAAAAPDFEVVHANSDGWTEWQIPPMSGYKMSCCDCGLVHETEFRVFRVDDRPAPKENYGTVMEPDAYRVQMRVRRA